MLNYNDFLIREYIENDIIYLKKYMNQTDDEKKKNLVHDYPYMFKRFCSVSNIDVDYFKTFDGEDYELIDEISDVNSEYHNYYIKFGDWLFKNINNYDLGILAEELPTWTYFNNPTLVKNQWLVHFTNEDAAYDIEYHGFTKGVYDVSKLGLTTCLADCEKDGYGYNFCYTVYDFKKYAKNKSRGYGRSEYKYGDYCVIFRGSGIRMYHNSDEEYQTLFYGKLAKDIHVLSKEYDVWTVFNKNRSKVIYSNESLEKVVDWFVNNYNQYKNII